MPTSKTFLPTISSNRCFLLHGPHSRHLSPFPFPFHISHLYLSSTLLPSHQRQWRFLVVRILRDQALRSASIMRCIVKGDRFSISEIVQAGQQFPRTTSGENGFAASRPAMSGPVVRVQISRPLPSCLSFRAVVAITVIERYRCILIPMFCLSDLP